MTLPAFGDGVPLAFEATVTEVDAARLRAGLAAPTMEDKWLVSSSR